MAKRLWEAQSVGGDAQDQGEPQKGAKGGHQGVEDDTMNFGVTSGTAIL